MRSEHLDGRVVLHGGDSRDVLKGLADCSIDSVVTDPPYALVSIVKRFGGENAAPANDNDVYARASAGFMGKQWDTGETAFATTFWAEIMRVLKPGGHVVAFSGTRTYHRLAVAIEDAGFEIRDQLAWVYGSGFPKSHDVSKAIDKAAGAERKRKPVEHRANPSSAIHASGFGAPDWSPQVNEPVTAAAAAWQGWGTALKPAWEPIVMARKPMAVPREVPEEYAYDADQPERAVVMRGATVAENVLEHGTGALNIDGCRVGDEERVNPPGSTNERVAMGGGWRADAQPTTATGRWPANIIHDGSDEVVAAFPSSNGAGEARSATPTPGSVWGIGAERSSVPGGATYADSGSAARFFYSAKADKQDRIGSKHPTVKPVDLMQWLCRLVTPPGGTVLDPFAGSGSTGEAAWREGFQCVLIEREPEYQADIAERLRLADKGPLERRKRAVKQADDAGPLFGANDNAPPTEATDRANRAQALVAGYLNTTDANQNSSSETIIDAA